MAELVDQVLDELEADLRRVRETLDELQETACDQPERAMRIIAVARQLMLDVGNVQHTVGGLLALEREEMMR